MLAFLNVCSYTVIKRMFGGAIMQIEQKSIFKFTPQIISKKLRHIFEETPADDQQAGLLTPQPAKQRQLFLKRAIKDKIKATFQLMPINHDGYPVNVTGNIAQLANSNRYLITNQNVSYVVNFDQIRYIANL